MDPFAIIAVFAGGVIALTGYRIFMDMQRFWGMLLIGAIGAYIATLLFPAAGGAFHLSVPLVAGFLIGGLAGALIARQLQMVIVFITGFIAGYVVITTGYHLIVTTLGMVASGPGAGTGADFRLVLGGPTFLVAMAVGVILGVVSMRAEEITLILSTAFIGSAMAIYGINSLLYIQPLIAIVIFFLVGLFGAAAQYTDAQRNT
jgi:hypothetical protein